MLITLLFDSHKDLKGHLERLETNKSGKYRYIFCGEKDAKAIHLLGKDNFQEIIHAPYDESYRKRFLKEYIDLVGNLGKDHNTKRWWATDIASKNRFTSRLPLLLHQFLGIVDTIQREECDQLIILDPSWVILDSLKKALKKNNLEFTSLERLQTKWKAIGQSWSRRVLSSFYNTLRVCLRKCYAQTKLKYRTVKNSSYGKSYYVIKTFVYDHSFSKDGTYQDVFFGTLPDFIEKTRLY